MLNGNIMNITVLKQRSVAAAAVLLVASLGATTANAAVVKDGHGNEGYTTAAECDQAVLNGTADFYESFTFKPPLKRSGEVSYEVMLLGDVAGYENGACDKGVGKRYKRDGVGPKIIGTYVPFSPTMKVNAYKDASGKIVRLMMQQCDNNFGLAMPRAVAGPAPVSRVITQGASVASDCFVDVVVPAKFATKTEKVVKVPATKRYEVIPATYKMVTEKVLVQPESVRQIPVAPTYKTTSERVVVKPATVNRVPVAPVFKTVTEKFLVKPESTKLRVIPATYKTVENRSISKPASTRLVPYPAQYEMVNERVKIAEGYKVWKRGRAWISQALDVRPMSKADDDVMCLVEVPPKYETVSVMKLKTPAGVREEKIPAEYCNCTKQVIDQPARTETITIPAEYRTVQRVVVDKPGDIREVPVEAVYETVTRTVVDKAASYREEKIPAVYETLSRRVIDKQGSTREINVPAVYETLSYRVKVSDASTERRQILCETNATAEKIREIQTALKKAGFDPGRIDGNLRGQTMRAVNSYQRAKGLPEDGYLNIETVKSLGVSAQ